MADKDYKAFIVEGEAREPQIINNISKIFFSVYFFSRKDIFFSWKLHGYYTSGRGEYLYALEAIESG